MNPAMLNLVSPHLRASHVFALLRTVGETAY
jgi:hypothetical protein